MGLAVVHLRLEQTRSAAALYATEAHWVRLRRDWWALQTRAARLRTPQRVHERVESLRADLIHPAAGVMRPPARLASDQP